MLETTQTANASTAAARLHVGVAERIIKPFRS